MKGETSRKNRRSSIYCTYDFLRDEILLFPRSRNGNAHATYKHYKHYMLPLSCAKKGTISHAFWPLTHYDIMMTRQLLEKSQPTQSADQHVATQNSTAFKAPAGGFFGWTASTTSRKCWRMKYQTIYRNHIYSLHESGCPANLVVVSTY